MPRGLDHLVIAVHDLDAAGKLYEAMGFLVGARNRHPWGTENRIVQMPGVFLELITLGAGAAIEPHAPGRFSFGAFVRDSLARREGIALTVLESDDSGADRDRFAAAGIGDFAPFFFERQALRPDGTSVRVAFSLAFAQDRLAPEVGFFVCQQHEPQNFWNPAFQRHPNGASGVAAVLMVSENPAAHAEFLSAFSGERELVSNSAGVAVPLPRGRIEVMTGAAASWVLGAPVGEEPPRFVGFSVAGTDVAAMESRLAAARIPCRPGPWGLVVPAEAAMGTALVFAR
ncbi:VOC family protein [uncultured Alsobacter sp.]|uniref:VOC family protein n=1 Tax=uncultured Alsobacter sp. TaxID=1748258 RepID=UPI0025DD6D4E|nr:VOC family protein [uncultured Alsobacter sp.]